MSDLSIGQNHFAGIFQLAAGPYGDGKAQHDRVLVMPFSGTKAIDFKELFAEVSRRLPEGLPLEILARGGTTASLACVSNGRIVAANLGDSRVSLFNVQSHNVTGQYLTDGQLIELSRGEPSNVSTTYRIFGSRFEVHGQNSEPDILEYNLDDLTDFQEGSHVFLCAESDGGHTHRTVEERVPHLVKHLTRSSRALDSQQFAWFLGAVAAANFQSEDNISVVATQLEPATPDHVIGVFDGIGIEGYQVAQVVRDLFAELIPQP